MTKVWLLAPLGAFIAVGAFFAAGLTRDPSRIPSELIDRPLPAFDLAAIEGFDDGLSSEDLRGDVSLINVWGSWCVSCHIEHPLLMEIAERGEAPIYGLNWKDRPGDGAAWLARFGNPYLRIGDDQAGRVAIDLGVTGAPETFVVDQDLRVRYKFVGPITREAWETTLFPLIEELRRS
ncbi:MAG: DsbE family thiol:disulfide interchange protein [Pseudomonadota bacterium]